MYETMLEGDFDTFESRRGVVGLEVSSSNLSL